ncbi:imidazoleglycerol-phosphate dehydratase HisB [Corynebacterium sp. TAE3-ERU12]|uniref:imidazoleglycerol-phosphate dehydratase HisB n=1 Tax=Corynebacterium sp. TAE3-ERU12 TaxID=2849491 RepID=UPI001C48DF65|nr:imidazoleglycerol-phosphate dehydratase HisB [Corynebacterium sp. TAE3-ERU12]MBV7296178.1 imidazoleglycerol-phosphate dehydratase HisB [Corynebacterium sp. TAE3-ERU12]
MGSREEQLDNEKIERVGHIERATHESTIVCTINLDGTGDTEVETGLPFFDHMLTAFTQHGRFDLKLHANGDTEVDAHHTVEDCGIVLGMAFAEALGEKKGIYRFGDCFVPMDESLAHAAVDVSGRPYFVMNGEPEHMVHQIIGGHYATVINQHFFESFAFNARIALHVRCLYGRDPHHITEAEFKAVARALRVATELDPRCSGVPSTKGSL